MKMLQLFAKLLTRRANFAKTQETTEVATPKPKKVILAMKLVRGHVIGGKKVLSVELLHPRFRGVNQVRVHFEDGASYYYHNQKVTLG